jgi:DNA repair protein RecN (Recombination protein N)
MLVRLVINDIVLIERLTLEFGADEAATNGLKVFTGETGAGKSILLAALSLALGGRGDVGVIRRDAEAASVSAEFALTADHPVQAWLEEQGLASSETLILRRSLRHDGKGRASINDQPVGVQLLKQCGQMLIEIHGQFETYGLQDPARHRQFLDAFGGHEALTAQVVQTHRAAQAADAAVTAALARRDKVAAEQDFIRAALAELDELQPQAGEAEILTAQRTRLQQREKILETLTQAGNLLGNPKGATRLVNEAAHAIAKLSHPDETILELLQNLDRLAAELAEAENRIEALAQDEGLDPAQLSLTEERLFALRALARKHQTEIDRLPELRENFAQQLTILEDDDVKLKTLQRAAQQARAAFLDACRALSAARHKAAEALTAAVNAELPALRLEQATLQMELTPLAETEWNALGAEKIQFLGQTNRGSAAGPLHKIASGGELARFMLALRVVLAAADPVPTLVFDEVDAGIGGATAAAVGERLAKLATSIQVLVITHSPQVAARGDQHWRVVKHEREAQTRSEIKLLSQHERLEEIARMLAGSAVTPAARAAAVDLMAESNPPKAGRAAATKSRRAS